MIGFLASYAYFKKVNVKQLKQRVKAPLFADSGAFSVFSRGDDVSIESYAKWLWQHIDCWEQYVNLDVIRDPTGTAINQAIMERYGLKPTPVIHFRSSLDDLKAILDKDPKTLAIGGMAFKVERGTQDAWLDTMFAHIPSTVRVHGFGMTRPDTMFRYPWSSVDSSSHLAGARYNSVRMFIDGTMKVVNLKTIKYDAAFMTHLEKHNQDPLRFVERRWHYRDTMALGSVATYLLSKHWAERNAKLGWNQPTLYLAASDMRAHTIASQAIQAYQAVHERGAA